MHDPMTVAHDIRFRGRSLATIWHVDPERDGSDDSCGWFIRRRHIDQEIVAKTARDFAFEWTHGVPFGWFASNGEPNFSTQAIVLSMFRIATGNMFGHWSRRQQRFFKSHLWEVLHFAENNCDSMFDFIQRSYGVESGETAEDRARRAANIIVPWIYRCTRPWYRHPRWHVHHWKLQVHGLQNFKRWAFSRCAGCGKRFRWGESPTSFNWNGTGPLWFRSEGGVYHSSCSSAATLAPGAQP